MPNPTYIPALPSERSNKEDKTRECAWPGCAEKGEYKAPKTREKIRSYHWLCLMHVRAYNKQWNYYAGMTEEEVEVDRRSDTVWDRATWPIGSDKTFHKNRGSSSIFHDELFCHLNEHIGEAFENNPFYETDNSDIIGVHNPSILSALTTLGLTAPVTVDKIKKQYKFLVKRYHPDANTDDPGAEEKFKELTEAYETLKGLFAP